MTFQVGFMGVGFIGVIGFMEFVGLRLGFIEVIVFTEFVEFIGLTGFMG